MHANSICSTRKDSQKCRTIRNGEIGIVASEDTYVGDLIEIHAGDEIPADGRVVQAQDLRINQSLLTGESEPVAKIDGTYLEDAEGTEHPACVYRGTQVVEGVGRVLITDVGDMTMIGQIARQLSLVGSSLDEESALVRVHRKLTVQKHQTPLQRKLSHLADLISKLGYAAAVLIFLAMLIRGYLMGEWKLSFAGADLRASLAAILEYFVYMVVVVVVAVPEGLPMSVSVSLALAMRKMTRANCHVRQLMACETIGSVSVICSDKTGTITLNEMRVDHVWTPESTNQPSERIVLNAALNSTAHLDPAAGDPSIIGSSTEGALLLWLKENQVDYRKVREEHAVLYQTHFDSQRKDMRSVVRLEASFT